MNVESLLSFKRLNELVLVFNSIIVFLISLVTHVNYPYVIALILFVSLSTFFLHANGGRKILWGHPIWTLLIIPLVSSILLLIVLQVIAHNVPGIAFYHDFLDSGSPVPSIPENVMVDISFVIPTRDENPDYIGKTIEYILTETPSRFMREIIFIDDASTVGSLQDIASSDKVHVIRLEERVGLTNAKIIGAKKAKGTHIFFLDAHCRVGPYFAERMLARMETFSDIIVPEVIDVKGDTFAFSSMDGGIKMMFDWTFDFSWFGDDSDDFVPISSGGILLMSRRFFLQAGQYDSGMLEWGGENIEQSLRTWQCGGRIIVEREAKVGHVFNRALAPNRISHVVVECNHARAAYVWLDRSLAFFEAKYPAGKTQLDHLGPGIDSRLELRNRLACKSFEFFENQFERVFDQTSLRIDKEYSLQHDGSGLCLTVLPLSTTGKVKERPVKLEWLKCELYSDAQRFSSVRQSTRIRNIAWQRCLERKGSELILVLCDFLQLKNVQDFKVGDNRITSNVDESISLRKEQYCVSGPELQVLKCGAPTDMDISKIYVGI